VTIADPQVVALQDVGVDVTGAAGAAGVAGGGEAVDGEGDTADIDDIDIPPPPQALRTAIEAAHAAAGNHRRRTWDPLDEHCERCIGVSLDVIVMYA
jgi:hypothetical protein